MSEAVFVAMVTDGAEATVGAFTAEPANAKERRGTTALTHHAFVPDTWGGREGEYKRLHVGRLQKRCKTAPYVYMYVYMITQ